MQIRFKLFTELWRCLFAPPQMLVRYRAGKRPEQLDGDCAVPPSPSYIVPAKDRVIRVRDDLDDKGTLEAACHEVTHAAFPFLKEEWVSEFARDQARLLIDIGFHRKECDDGT